MMSLCIRILKKEETETEREKQTKSSVSEGHAERNVPRMDIRIGFTHELMIGVCEIGTETILEITWNTIRESSHELLVMQDCSPVSNPVLSNG